MANKIEDSSSIVNTQRVVIILRPMYLDWQMGEDWELSLPITTTFIDLKEIIETEKGFSRHRINLKLKGKILPANKEKWTIRRMGIYDGYILTVEATFPGSWWWNSIDYYADKLLCQTETIIDENGGGVFLSDLESKIILSPPIKTSLRVFLRKYPERIQIYCNTTTNSLWIERTKNSISFPVFSPVPHTLGYYKHYQPNDINWSELKEFDDRNQIIEYRENQPKVPTIELFNEIEEERKEDQNDLSGISNNIEKPLDDIENMTLENESVDDVDMEYNTENVDVNNNNNDDEVETVKANEE